MRSFKKTLDEKVCLTAAGMSKFWRLLKNFKAKFGAIFLKLFIGEKLNLIKLAPGALIQNCRVALKSGLLDGHV